jgi:purine-cytosine permease-like protein
MGLSLKAACLVILFFNLLGGIPPAAFCILGPKTGMRQLVQARYTFGLYFVTVASIMNMATTTGWGVIGTIVAGQTLSAVSGGSMSWAVGIVLVCLISLVIAFMGYKVVHFYERWAWIPSFIAILIAVGCGGHLLKHQAPTAPSTAQGVLSFGCTITSFTMTWATMASDFSVYITPQTTK